MPMLEYWAGKIEKTQYNADSGILGSVTINVWKKVTMEYYLVQVKIIDYTSIQGKREIT